MKSSYLYFHTVYSISVLGIGAYHAFTGQKQSTTEDFIVANRQLHCLPVAVSMVVSFISGISVLGLSAEVYTSGIIELVGDIVGSFITVNILSFFIIPWLYPLKLTSVNSFLEMRFGNPMLTKIASCFGILGGILWSCVALFGPSLALETVTGISALISMPSATIVCIIFTSMGGMRAVVWTDVFQAMMMVIGCLTIFIKATMLNGGLRETFSTLSAEGRTVINISPDPTVRHTIWGFIFGKPFTFLIYFSIGQQFIQRYSAVPTLKQARLIPYFYFIGITILLTVMTAVGIGVFVYYAKAKCDPLASGQILNINQILPLFISHILNDTPCLAGLFLATIFSSSLSTISTNLSAISTNILIDFVCPMFPHMSDHKASVIGKILVLIAGVVILGLGFITSRINSPLIQIALSATAIANGPLLALFILGGLRIFRKINIKGITLGCVIGFGFCVWIYAGLLQINGSHPPMAPVSVEECGMSLNITHPEHQEIHGFERFYLISYLWYGAIAIFTTIITGTIASYLFNCFKSDERPIPDHLFMSLLKPWKNSRQMKMELKQQDQLNDQILEEFPLNTEL